jgi:hypothetical protein
MHVELNNAADEARITDLLKQNGAEEVKEYGK